MTRSRHKHTRQARTFRRSFFSRFFRNFTARAVREHLRSQLEDAGSGAELTPNEAELVRFAADRSQQLKELAEKTPPNR